MADYSSNWLEKLFTPQASAYRTEAGMIDTSLGELDEYKKRLEKQMRERQRLQFKEGLNTLAKYNMANSISVGNMVTEQNRDFSSTMNEVDAEIELARAEMRRKQKNYATRAHESAGSELIDLGVKGVGLALSVAAPGIGTALGSGAGLAAAGAGKALGGWDSSGFINRAADQGANAGGTPSPVSPATLGNSNKTQDWLNAYIQNRAAPPKWESWQKLTNQHELDDEWLRGLGYNY